MVQDLRWASVHRSSAVEPVDVYAAVIPSVKFKPGLHVHYQETVLPMKDGLPKQKDVPEGNGRLGSAVGRNRYAGISRRILKIHEQRRSRS